jgi:predicted DNA-binding transcriptional regulator
LSEDVQGPEKRPIDATTKEKKIGDPSDILGGTTLRVYRFMFREGKPLGAHEIQRGLELSSPSVAHYHLKKLVDAGLVKQIESGYVVDKVVFENMIRIRRSFVPLQTTYLIFFSTTLAVLLTVLRGQSFLSFSIYIFALVVNAAAVGIFAYEVFKSVRKNRL